MKTKRIHPSTVSAWHQQPTKALKQKGLSCCPKAPCKAVKNAILNWFKRPGDSKMPSTKELLKQRYEQTKNRSKNDRTYLNSGKAPIIDLDANADDEQNAGGEWWELSQWLIVVFRLVRCACIVRLWKSVDFFAASFFVWHNTTIVILYVLSICM